MFFEGSPSFDDWQDLLPLEAQTSPNHMTSQRNWLVKTYYVQHLGWTNHSIKSGHIICWSSKRVLSLEKVVWTADPHLIGVVPWESLSFSAPQGLIYIVGIMIGPPHHAMGTLA